MAELTNLRIVDTIADELAYGPGEVISRERLNRSVKGLSLSASDVNFLASRMGVQPGTVKGWLSPTSQSQIIPRSMIGKLTLGGDNITAEWRNRAILGLALTGSLESTSPESGPKDRYKDEASGSLETVFKRLSSYTGYGIDSWRNESWRSVRIDTNKYGRWVIYVAYERIGSPGESKTDQQEIDLDDEDVDPSLFENWGLDET